VLLVQLALQEQQVQVLQDPQDGLGLAVQVRRGLEELLGPLALKVPQEIAEQQVQLVVKAPQDQQTVQLDLQVQVLQVQLDLKVQALPARKAHKEMSARKVLDRQVLQVQLVKRVM
jgi:hypothetical protein